jgi:trigger factor
MASMALACAPPHACGTYVQRWRSETQMLQVTVEKLSPVLVEFRIKVSADEVKESVDRAFNDLARSAHIKGFRKGKAPRHVLAHLFGDRVASEVGSKLVDDTFPKAVQQQKVQPVSRPVIEKAKVSATEDFAYKARFEVVPTIESVAWEGIEAKRAVYTVDDKMVDDELERLRVQHATLVAPEPQRPSQNGDVLTIDFTLEVDGAAVEGATTKDLKAELGSTNLLQPLGDALLGKQAGEKVDVDVTFPDNHQQELLRGKKGLFHVAVKDVKQKVLPALDDEFAKDVGQGDTLDALKTSIRERLGKALKERSDNELAEVLVAELCKKNPIPVPPSLVEQQTRLQENEVVQQARRQNPSVRNLSPELRQAIAADAEMKVRAGLLMAEIAKSKSMQVTDEDIQKAYVELAEQSGKNVAKIKSQYQDPKQREMLIGLIVEDKVLNLIEAAAKLEDVPTPVQG